jgi:aspartyl-tRNA(Asn)/glutamyl-tRNA(Gln) amidotransferase subunit B
MVKTRSEDMPSKLAEESLGLGRHSTSSQLSSQNLRTLCEEVVRAFPEESAKVKRLAGDAPVMNRLIGAVMKRSKGRADAVAARKILVSIIGDADVS